MRGSLKLMMLATILAGITSASASHAAPDTSIDTSDNLYGARLTLTPTGTPSLDYRLLNTDLIPIGHRLGQSATLSALSRFGVDAAPLTYDISRPADIRSQIGAMSRIRAGVLPVVSRLSAPPADTPPAPSGTSDGPGSRRFTFWFGGPAVLDYRPGNSGAFTIGIGVGPTELSNSSSNVIDSSTGNAIDFSVIGEAFYYPNHRASGLAFNVRVGSANGIYAAPGIFYVSRPKGSICGRYGLMVPIGGGTLPFLPEVAIGFRF